jgi:hypothetical protein
MAQGGGYRKKWPLASKLGKCARCMRASAWGALAGWMAVLLLRLIWPRPLALGLSSLLALAFTSLLSAHLIAFGRWIGAALRAAHRTLPAGVINDWGRLEFVFLVGRLTLAHLRAVVLGQNEPDIEPHDNINKPRYHTL